MQTKRKKPKAVALLSACALAALSTTAHATADQVSATYTGPGEENYATPTSWDLGVVPNNSNGTTYNVDLGSSYGVSITTDIAVDSISSQSYFEVQDASFIVNGTSSIRSVSVFANTSNASASLGTISAFNPAGTNQLDGTSLDIESSGTNTAALQFQGADIFTTYGNLRLRGNSTIIDESGNDALRDYASNSGWLAISDRAFTASRDFNNTGTLQLGDPDTGLSTTFTVSGNLQNFDLATKTLSGGTFMLTGSATTTLRFTNADIVHNNAFIELDYPGAQIVDQFGNNALRNLAEIGQSGTLVLQRSSFTTAGDFTNNGELSLGHDQQLKFSINSPLAYGDDGYHPVFTVAGQFTNYSNNTLSGGTFDFDGATLKFNNADIINNAATINIHQFGISIVDENGSNGLRNFAHNLAAGNINIYLGTFTTPGDFVNDGNISALGAFSVMPDAAAFSVSGNLTNTGSITLGQNSPLLSISQNPAVLDVAGIASNTGSVTIGYPGSLSAGTAYVQTSGTTSLFTGTLQAPVIQILGGTLAGYGGVSGSTTISGTLAPTGAHSSSAQTYGELQFQSSVTLTGAAHSSFHIGGNTRASSYDDISVSSSITVTGELDVTLDYPILFLTPCSPPPQPNYIPLPTDQFILLSASEIDGQFDNAPDGSRLETTDGYGSFLVEYLQAQNGNPAEVVLIDFESGTPEPTALGVIALASAFLIKRRRRIRPAPV
jgi:hypothetical protein